MTEEALQDGAEAPEGRERTRKASAALLVLGSALGSMGMTLSRVIEHPTREAADEWARCKEREANERRWAEMTQGDIDRLTAAEAKRSRRGAR